MSIEIQIHNGPLADADLWRPDAAGAVLVFEGIVRPTEQDRPLAALQYQVYEPMTTSELHKLARQIVDRYRLLGMRVQHSAGVVPAGQCSFRLSIASAHRGEALAAMDQFIVRMKREIPIWKLPCWL